MQHPPPARSSSGKRGLQEEGQHPGNSRRHAECLLGVVGVVRRPPTTKRAFLVLMSFHPTSERPVGGFMADEV